MNVNMVAFFSKSSSRSKAQSRLVNKKFTWIQLSILSILSILLPKFKIIHSNIMTHWQLVQTIMSQWESTELDNRFASSQFDELGLIFKYLQATVSLVTWRSTSKHHAVSLFGEHSPITQWNFVCIVSVSYRHVLRQHFVNNCVAFSTFNNYRHTWLDLINIKNASLALLKFNVPPNGIQFFRIKLNPLPLYTLCESSWIVVHNFLSSRCISSVILYIMLFTNKTELTGYRL